MEKMTTCQELMACLSDYIDLELEPGVVKKIDEHTETCSSCRGFKETLQSTVQLVRQRKTPLDPKIHDRLMSYLRSCLGSM